MLEKFRNNIFWAKDRFTNSNSILKNYKEIKSINENPTSETSKKLIEKNLSKLLKYAVKETEFYKNINPEDLLNFPIIDKSIITANNNDFLTLDKKYLKSSTTSGSTGHPLTVYQDKKKIDRHTADMIYFNEIANYNLGNRLYYFRVWNNKNAKSSLESFLHNIKMIDISNFSIDKLNNLINSLSNDKSTKSILSFASSLEILENHIKTESLDLQDVKLKSIISMSEALPISTKKFLMQQFHCPVFSRYSNMENGFIAQQQKNSEDYYINNASFYVEILKFDENIRAEDGEMGRIVVTDLFNYGMPIIRYDTGDIGVFSNINGSVILKSIEGRKTDFIYDVNGNVLSPHVITNTMWFFAKEVNQFQFIQHDLNNYEIKINLKKSDTVFLAEKLNKHLKAYLGDDANIKQTFVDEIPVLSSGKRKKVVNLMNTKR